MNFNQLCTQLQEGEAWLNRYSVVCLKGTQDYPLLFFSLFIKKLQSIPAHVIETIDLAHVDSAQAQSMLQTSFLGMRVCYWLQNINELDEKKQKFWLGYVQQYTGPHTLIFYTNDQEFVLPRSKNLVLIMVPESLDEKAGILLFQSLNQKGVTVQWAPLCARLFKKFDTLSLESACLLMYYIRLLGAHVDAFLDQWLNKILMPEQSLFTLSTYFFAKKNTLFFKQWSAIQHDYAEVFWVSYWSEQSWRAYHFVNLMRSNNVAEAKKIGTRLPFSFMQKDWRLHSLEQLQALHNDIYAVDYALKNGASCSSLDVVYSKFLSE